MKELLNILVSTFVSLLRILHVELKKFACKWKHVENSKDETQNKTSKVNLREEEISNDAESDCVSEDED